MRVLVLICLLSGFVVGCNRRQDAATKVDPSSQPTTWEPPKGTLDAIFAEIVRTDWQTAGAWGRSPKPPLDFIAKVRDEADFRRVELDGTYPEERIICLNYSPGQKP